MAEKKKMGRPEKTISQAQFEAMCSIQATEEEICLVLDVQPHTLNKWCRRIYGKTFCKVFREKRALGHVSLRRKQFHLADKSPAMAIFLGKNYLGQSDNPTATVEISDVPVFVGESEIEK